MSDTPKTDELAKREFVPDGVWIRHARELERENDALHAAIAAMPTCRCELSTEDQCNLCVENAALREDRERLNWMDEYDAEVQKYENPEDGSKRYEIWFFVDTDPSPIFSAPTLRAAIDTARGATRKEAKP